MPESEDLNNVPKVSRVDRCVVVKRFSTISMKGETPLSIPVEVNFCRQKRAKCTSTWATSSRRLTKTAMLWPKYVSRQLLGYHKKK